MADINNYEVERCCSYKEEEYLVRDNGAVFRKSRSGSKVRKWDNVWTFGIENKQTKYLVIGSVPIHRIVATAFYGVPASGDYVVDHIDTNRHNNRPNNLRWVTRFENLINNPLSRKKIEYITGVSIYDFLKNPALYLDSFKNSDFSWMRTVNEDEAKACLINLEKLSEKKSDVSNRDVVVNKKVGIGEWIYAADQVDIDNIINKSLTPLAVQCKWHTPTKFCCCPGSTGEDPIKSYYDNLSQGAIFSENEYGRNIVVEYAMSNETILIICSPETETVKQFFLAKISFENGHYIHENCGSYFTYDGAKKYFVLEQGKEWTGGFAFDDYC